MDRDKANKTPLAFLRAVEGGTTPAWFVARSRPNVALDVAWRSASQLDTMRRILDELVGVHKCNEATCMDGPCGTACRTCVRAVLRRFPSISRVFLERRHTEQP